MKIESYRDLEVWQKGRELVKSIYDLTEKFPSAEKFGLISQIRRAATSISANLAEGWARRYPAEFIQYIRNAHGSLAELETHLILSHDLSFLTKMELDHLLANTTVLSKQLLALERSVLARKSAQ